MTTQEEIIGKLRTMIETCVVKLSMQILETINSRGTFSAAVENTQKTVNGLGIDVLQLLCSEVDDGYDKQRDRHKIIIKNKCKTRTLLTSMGEITLARRLYLNKTDESYFFAVDDLLGIEKNSRIEQNLKSELIKNATLMSFGKASELVDHKVSRQTVHNLVKGIKTVDMIKTSPLQRKKEVAEIYIEADEDHIHLQNGNSAEVKLVYVHEGVKTICKDRTQLDNVRYFVSADNDPDKIWNDVAYYLYKTYSMLNTKVHISGDGAYWIKFGKQILPKAEYHIDKFHIQKSATIMAKGSIMLKSQIIKAMRSKNKEKLREIYKLQFQKATERSERKTIANNYFYLENNIDAYSALNRCSAEGHVSHVLSARMSSRPMAWSIAGADRIAKLRAYYFNNGDFAKLVAGDEVCSDTIFNSSIKYNIVKESVVTASYNRQAHVVGIDGITNEISRKLRKILNF